LPETAALAEPATRLRVATYNVSFYTDRAGALPTRLDGSDPRAIAVAAVIQRVRPDLLLLNEFDFEPDGRSAALFQRDLLGQSQHGGSPIHYPHVYQAAVNTGEPSGMDLDGDGRNDSPGDAWGFGQYPGQYGMLVLSRYPIDRSAVRSFRTLRWSSQPHALKPVDSTSKMDFYPPQVWSQLRLSSKSHWDIPIVTPDGPLHFLVMHPTPPVFDGPEDRNGRRNHDEIRLFADYLGPATHHYLVDDAGVRGGLPADQAFVLAGDFNADPLDGDSWPGAIDQLLHHPRVNAGWIPSSAGAVIAEATRSREQALKGDAAAHTSSFGLRVDYVLPSKAFRVVAGGVYWPPPDDPDAALIEGSDHRLVWLDVERLSD
jgi:endonuclease/exonuclease/phosphatase family metal-dependent hydrolase